jgi:hypothetical protein
VEIARSEAHESVSSFAVASEPFRLGGTSAYASGSGVFENINLKNPFHQFRHQFRPRIIPSTPLRLEECNSLSG